MNKKSMTALISLFARAYHSQNNKKYVFDDKIAKKLISDSEYESISKSMADGITFFSPDFSGTREEALKYIVDNQLSPSPLGRQAFCEQSLRTASLYGVRQYIIFAAGYDSFAYRTPKWAKDIEIFEIDRSEMIEDKFIRLKAADIEPEHNTHYIKADLSDRGFIKHLKDEPTFINDSICFCSMLGLTYYLNKPYFENLLAVISDFSAEGSSVVFDYPVSLSGSSQTQKQTELAAGADEKMLSQYLYEEIEKLLSQNGFLIYEHLTPCEITKNFFDEYNRYNQSNKMKAADNVNYCLAVKK